MKRAINNTIVVALTVFAISVWCFLVIPALTDNKLVALILGIVAGYAGAPAVQLFWKGKP